MSIRLLAVLFLLPALPFVVACGGDDDSTPENGPEATQSTNNGDNGNGGDNGDNGNGNGNGSSLPQFGDGGMAVITVDGERFEVILENRTVAGSPQLGFCREIFGALQIFGYADTDDGGFAELTMWIPPTDWETYDDGRYDPPEAELEISGADGRTVSTLVANPENTTFTGSSQIDEYELDGRTASGTMTFSYETPRDTPPVTGSFEVNCGEG